MKRFPFRSGMLLSTPGVVVIFLLLSPLLSIGNQVTFVAVAGVLHAATAVQFFTHLLTQAGLDPVYASVFNQSIGTVEVRGLVVAGPIGEALHQWAPGFFASSDQNLPGTWASAIVSDGAAVLALAVARISAEAAVITVGLVLVGLGFWLRNGSKRPWARALLHLGLLFQIRGAVGVLGVRFTVEDMESMGLSQIFTKLVPLEAEAYRILVLEPLEMTGHIVIPVGILLTIYAPITGAAFIRNRLRRRSVRPECSSGSGHLGVILDLPRGKSAWARTRTVLMAAVLVSLALLSQRFFPAEASYSRSDENSAQVAADGSLGAAPTVSASPIPEVAGPSKVTISGANYDYVYTVNGRREKIRGVGYNPTYTQLSSEERAARYDQDFAQMRAAGINTILAWGPQQFDEMTLTRAQANGLGVVMPYHLPSDGAYRDPVYQDKQEQEILRWIERFRSYPALRMWGIGNEVIHGMGKNPDTPQSEAFARFYVRLIDNVRALDPDHPITYRAAEDVYLKPMKTALLREPRARPWFVYGVNFFTFRICDALRNWPQKGVDAPIMVSEFAPAGLSREERPNGYRRMWTCIADNPKTVLGGFAYVWNTIGPEALDRSFGLTDQDNRPTDNSLATLSELYRQDKDG